MKSSSDPTIHRQRERKLLEHVQRLLADDRLRVDTSAGARSVTTLIRDVVQSDHAMDLKRTMSDMGMFDRELQNRMPTGEMVEVAFGLKRWFLFRQTVGRMRVVCVSPTQDLLKGQPPQPMAPSDVQRTLASLPPALRGEPVTVVLMSTSGFTPEAHGMADRTAARSVILVEPDDAGGWTVTGPPESRDIADLFDPEGEDEKKQRVRDEIDKSRMEIGAGGVSADRLASRLKVPEALVEAELKAHARAHPGLAAKRLDGRFVLFREGSAPSASAAAGGFSMPLIDRMRALFSRKADDAKKVAFLSERRAALSQQRDLAYEELGALEKQEESLRTQFKESSGSITKKRVTSQLLQLRKDLERRQQLLQVLNNQINVVSTHLHNLELVQQGESAKLPDTEEMTEDAVKAEEMLAELEANAEIAGSVGMSVKGAGLTAEEQALFEELEAEALAEKGEPAKQPDAPDPARAARAEPPRRDRTESTLNNPPPIPTRTRRGEAEPG